MSGILALVVLIGTAASAETAAFGFGDAGSLVGRIKAFKISCPAPRPGGRDDAGPKDCEAGLGTLSAALQAAAIPDGAASVVSLNTGFQALGAVGTSGSVNGPGSRGNGRYKVLKNESYSVALKMDTGYMDMEFHLMRDAKTGTDSLRTYGRKWDRNAGDWGPKEDKTFEARFTYNAKTDSGTIRYKVSGSWKEETYWGGRAGRTAMAIEFGGGWDHSSLAISARCGIPIGSAFS